MDQYGVQAKDSQLSHPPHLPLPVSTRAAVLRVTNTILTSKQPVFFSLYLSGYNSTSALQDAASFDWGLSWGHQKSWRMDHQTLMAVRKVDKLGGKSSQLRPKCGRFHRQDWGSSYHILVISIASSQYGLPYDRVLKNWQQCKRNEGFKSTTPARHTSNRRYALLGNEPKWKTATRGSGLY